MQKRRFNAKVVGRAGMPPPKKAPRVAHCWHACGQSTPERRASTVDAAERKKEGARICDEGPGRRADLGVRGVLLRARGLVHHLLVAVVGVVCVPHRVVVGPVVAHNPVVSDCDGYPRKKKRRRKTRLWVGGTRRGAVSAHRLEEGRRQCQSGRLHRASRTRWR